MKVNETGKPGKIDLTVSIKKTARNGAMHITGKFKATMPESEPMETLLFATENGVLTPDNPRQSKLDLKVVEERNESLKTIKGAN